MDTLEAIYSRKSVRKYSGRRISDQDLHAILLAGMSGPSCVNARDWSFLVVRDKEMLSRMAQANGSPAKPLLGADAGILICGDLNRSFPRAREYWVIDGAIAAQNMTLAAHALGIGSVWLGTWPQMDRVKKQAELFCLPEHIVPHSILAFGYPAEEMANPEGSGSEPGEAKWEAERVHLEKW
ncbi:MAG: nitroreductase family protein [Faecousia sp.]